MNTTDQLHGRVEYVYCVSEQLEVKIEGHEPAVFLSPIKGGNDIQTGDTITLSRTGVDWTVEINNRPSTAA